MLTVVANTVDLEVPLPSELRAYGAATTARLTGNRSGPLIAVLGGISGNRYVAEGADGGGGWWPGFVGNGCVVDPAHHCVLGLDFIADRQGQSAPSTYDQARVLSAALEVAGYDGFDLVVGASYGGMTALSFAEIMPEKLCKLAVISAAHEPHPTATAVRELQRRTVALGLACGAEGEALSIARGIAMLSYRSPQEFAQRFEGGIPNANPLAVSAPGQYLKARGEAFQNVMSPQRFLSLSGSIDRHRVDPSNINTPTLLIGATSDQVVPPEQLQDLARTLSGKADLHMRESLYGHDMFLKEAPVIGDIIRPFMEDLG